jgi:hypothetical protein
LLFLFIAAHKSSNSLIRTIRSVRYLACLASLSRFCHCRHAVTDVTPVLAEA